MGYNKTFTFIILTFTLSLFLYLGGVTSNNSLSAIGFIINLTQGDISSTFLWTALLVFIGIITAAATANTLTGGNSGAAITLGLAAFSIWALSLVGDFVTVINAVGNGCVTSLGGAFFDGGLCTIAYWITYIFGILILVGFIMSLFELIGGID